MDRGAKPLATLASKCKCGQHPQGACYPSVLGPKSCASESRFCGRQAQHLERDMGPDNSWQVLAAPEGGLCWYSSAGKLDRERARHVWQRVQNLLFTLLPASSC